MHCSSNADQVLALRDRLPPGALTAIALPLGSSASQEQHNLSITDFNVLHMSKPFWEALPTELVLSFELDSVLIDFDAMVPFMGVYDFVGAPWNAPWGACCNGGFSLRSRSAHLRILNELAPAAAPRPGDRQGEFIHEDEWWRVQAPALRMPSAKTATAFAVELLYHPAPAGYHKPYAYQLPSAMEQIYARFRAAAKAAEEDAAGR